MSKKLDGKVSIVTGGASGFGEATVRQFVQEGSKVVVVDINTEKGRALEQELTSSGADVTDEQAVEKVIAKTVAKYNRLDVLFNNAGTVNIAYSHEMEFADWRKTMALNIDAVFLMA